MKFLSGRNWPLVLRGCKCQVPVTFTETLNSTADDNCKGVATHHLWMAATFSEALSFVFSLR